MCYLQAAQAGNSTVKKKKKTGFWGAAFQEKKNYAPLIYEGVHLLCRWSHTSLWQKSVPIG